MRQLVLKRDICYVEPDVGIDLLVEVICLEPLLRYCLKHQVMTSCEVEAEECGTSEAGDSDELTHL